METNDRGKDEFGFRDYLKERVQVESKNQLKIKDSQFLGDGHSLSHVSFSFILDAPFTSAQRYTGTSGHTDDKMRLTLPSVTFPN